MKKMIKSVLNLGKVGLKPWKINLSNMEANLDGADKLKHKDDIQSNRDHLDSLKTKTSSEWRDYATQCMVEILSHKDK